MSYHVAAGTKPRSSEEQQRICAAEPSLQPLPGFEAGFYCVALERLGLTL